MRRRNLQVLLSFLLHFSIHFLTYHFTKFSSTKKKKNLHNYSAFDSDMQDLVLSLVKLNSFLMEKDAFTLAFGKKYDNEICSLSTVKNSIQELYSKKGPFWRIILDYMSKLKRVFKNAVAHDQHLLLNSNNVFNLNFPKLSCLLSLPVTLYFTGSFVNSDSSKVCIFIYLLFFLGGKTLFILDVYFLLFLV